MQLPETTRPRSVAPRTTTGTHDPSTDVCFGKARSETRRRPRTLYGGHCSRGAGMYRGDLLTAGVIDTARAPLRLPAQCAARRRFQRPAFPVCVSRGARNGRLGHVVTSLPTILRLRTRVPPIGGEASRSDEHCLADCPDAHCRVHYRQCHTLHHTSRAAAPEAQACPCATAIAQVARHASREVAEVCWRWCGTSCFMRSSCVRRIDG